MAGCGFGVGAVNGQPRTYQGSTVLGFRTDAGGQYEDSSGKRYSATVPIILGQTHWTTEGQGHVNEDDATGLRPGLRVSITALSLGKIAIHMTAELRYLLTPKAMLLTGGTTEPMSYSGWSSGFALNFVL